MERLFFVSLFYYMNEMRTGVLSQQASLGKKRENKCELWNDFFIQKYFLRHYFE